MKIVWNYIFIVTGLCLLLQIAGIQVSGLSQLFNMLGLSFGSNGLISLNSTPTFWTFLFGTTTIAGITISNGILLAITAGVIIGVFTRASPENFIILPFISSCLVLFASAIYSIITFSISHGTNGVLSQIIGTVTVLIMTPYAIALIAAFVDYFRGGDF